MPGSPAMAGEQPVGEVWVSRPGWLREDDRPVEPLVDPTDPTRRALIVRGALWWDSDTPTLLDATPGRRIVALRVDPPVEGDTPTAAVEAVIPVDEGPDPGGFNADTWLVDARRCDDGWWAVLTIPTGPRRLIHPGDADHALPAGTIGAMHCRGGGGVGVQIGDRWWRSGGTPAPMVGEVVGGIDGGWIALDAETRVVWYIPVVGDPRIARQMGLSTQVWVRTNGHVWATLGVAEGQTPRMMRGDRTSFPVDASSGALDVGPDGGIVTSPRADPPPGTEWTSVAPDDTVTRFSIWNASANTRLLGPATGRLGCDAGSADIVWVEASDDGLRVAAMSELGYRDIACHTDVVALKLAGNPAPATTMVRHMAWSGEDAFWLELAPDASVGDGWEVDVPALVHVRWAIDDIRP